MKNKQIFCAIFAIATVATAALMTTGCSKDEEYDMQTYDDEYTLAEPMMTRSTEGTYTPGGPSDFLKMKGGSESEYINDFSPALLRITYYWTPNYTAIGYSPSEVSANVAFVVDDDWRNQIRYSVIGIPKAHWIGSTGISVSFDIKKVYYGVTPQMEEKITRSYSRDVKLVYENDSTSQKGNH